MSIESVDDSVRPKKGWCIMTMILDGVTNLILIAGTIMTVLFSFPTNLVLVGFALSVLSLSYTLAVNIINVKKLLV